MDIKPIDQEQDTQQVYENDIDMYLHLFCEEQGIEDMKRESQGVWNACLIYIKRNVFNVPGMLKYNKPLEGYVNNALSNNLNNSNCNAYDLDKINAICDFYIYLCYRYDKEVSIMGFSKLTGINQDTIHDWGNEINKLSKSGCEIYKKLHKEREESLAAKLASNKNPVAIISILNKNFGWNLPGVSRENSGKRVLTAEELPKLPENG